MSTFSEQIKKVREASVISEVVSDYVNLKKSGKNFLGLCPFPDHNERTPSFNVNEEIKIYKCFGCGKSGDVFKFLQEIEGMSFIEALGELARRYSVDIDLDYNSMEKNEKVRNRICSINEIAAKHFQNSLINGKEGIKAFDYLRKRGLSEQIINEFRIGYSLRNDQELGKILKKEGYSEEETFKLGLVKSGYSRFQGRITFPIFDRFGKVVAFGGRRLGDDGPKYLNSMENPMFNKSKILYGLNFAGKHIKQAGRIIIVEGYMDCISMHAAGYRETVAPLGTSITTSHISRIVKMTDRINLFMDSDNAGLNAAIKVGANFSSFDHEPFIVNLGQLAKDPDEFLKRYGVSMLDNKINDALSYIDFVLSLLPGIIDINTISGKTRAVREYLAPLLSSGSPLKLSEYSRKITSFLDISLGDLKQIVRSRPRVNRETPEKNKTMKKLNPLHRELITALLSDPSLVKEYEDTSKEYDIKLEDKALEDLIGKIGKIKEKNDLSMFNLEINNNPYCEEVTGLLMDCVETPDKLLHGCLSKMKSEKIDQELVFLEKKIKTLEKSGEFDKIREFQKRYLELVRSKAML